MAKPSSTTRATIEAVLNTPQANLIMVACVVALLARLGVDVSGILGPPAAAKAAAVAECPPCPQAPAPKSSFAPAPEVTPDPNAAPASLDGAPPEDDAPAMSLPPSTG